MVNLTVTFTVHSIIADALHHQVIGLRVTETPQHYQLVKTVGSSEISVMLIRLECCRHSLRLSHPLRLYEYKRASLPPMQTDTLSQKLLKCLLTTIYGSLA